LKLHNEIKTVEIGGHPVRVGRLTVAAACEIEAYLETLETPLEFIDSKILGKGLPEAESMEVADIIMQRAMEWPPDAIGAICSVAMLRKATFARVFIKAVLRSYNGHMAETEIDKITDSAFVPFDALQLQPIVLGVSTDPKDESGLGVATGQPSGSSGGESSL
jgi:hypothetical protein